MKKKVHLVALALLAVPRLSVAGGTVGFEFLRTQMGARPSAMAGAFVSIPGDLYAIYYNPAGLAEAVDRSFTATYLNHLLDFQSGFAAYLHPAGKRGKVAAGIHYIDYGTFQKTDDFGNDVGSFGANSLVLSVSYSAKLHPKVLYGVTAKYIRSSIDQYTSDAFAADAGLMVHVPFDRDLDVGVGVSNVGQVRTAFIKTKEELPFLVSAGLSKRLAHLPLLYSVNVFKYRDTELKFALGGEFTLTEQLFLRLGYNSLGRDQRVGMGRDRIAGASIGLGLKWSRYHLDYAFSSFGEVGSLNRISFSGTL